MRAISELRDVFRKALELPTDAPVDTLEYRSITNGIVGPHVLGSEHRGRVRHRCSTPMTSSSSAHSPGPANVASTVSSSVTDADRRVALVTGATRESATRLRSGWPKRATPSRCMGVGPSRPIQVAAQLTDRSTSRRSPRRVRRRPPRCGSSSRFFDRFRRLDALVVNAGARAAAPLGLISDDDLARLFSVTALGATQTLAEARVPPAPRGAAAAGPVPRRLVVGRRGPARQEQAYAATKGAVIALTLAAAKELGPAGIRVERRRPGVYR